MAEQAPPASPASPPVLLLVFNRPDLAARVFEAIRQARPARLFIAGDGPRAGRDGEAELCEQCRALAGRVDWPCEVRTRFLPTNAGCKAGVSGAISWFFEQVESGIILEDDCLPDPSFFPYCAALLELYRDDERVGMVSGNNFVPAEEWAGSGHDFSAFTLIWGWATWRRAWQKFNPYLIGWPECRARGWVREIVGEKYAADHWTTYFDRCHSGCLDSWAFPWTYSSWRAGLLCIIPACNLVSNIGFDERGTHTTNANNRNSRLPVRAIETPVERRPVELNTARDRRFLKLVFDLSPPPREKKKLKTRWRVFQADVRLAFDKFAARFSNGRKSGRRRVIRVLKAAEPYVPGKVDLDGITWAYPDAPTFAAMFSRIFGAAVYDIPPQPEARRIIDCGANIGVSAVHLARRHPEAEVLAIEPDPDLAAYLEKNLTAAGATRARVLRKALWSEPGELTYIPGGAEGGRVLAKALVAGGAGGAGEVRVPASTLAQLIGETEVDLLKVSATGAEGEILIGQEAALRKVRRLFVEYQSRMHDEQRLDQLLGTLKRAGFRVHLQAEEMSSRPFVWWPDTAGLDNQVRIFAWRK